MISKKLKRFAATLSAIIFLAYIFAPLLAGFIGIGTRDGPMIYPQSYHRIIYSIGFCVLHEEEPREPYFLSRPYFYGGPRILQKEYRLMEGELQGMEAANKCRIIIDSNQIVVPSAPHSSISEDSANSSREDVP